MLGIREVETRVRPTRLMDRSKMTNDSGLLFLFTFDLLGQPVHFTMLRPNPCGRNSVTIRHRAGFPTAGRRDRWKTYGTTHTWVKSSPSFLWAILSEIRNLISWLWFHCLFLPPPPRDFRREPDCMLQSGARLVYSKGLARGSSWYRYVIPCILPVMQPQHRHIGRADYPTPSSAIRII